MCGVMRARVWTGPTVLCEVRDPKFVQIVFETHSTSEDSKRGIATGWLPGRLSERGQRQAEQLGQRRQDGISDVFVSDLARSVETAHIAFRGTDLRVIPDRRLRERNSSRAWIT